MSACGRKWPKPRDDVSPMTSPLLLQHKIDRNEDPHRLRQAAFGVGSELRGAHGAQRRLVERRDGRTSSAATTCAGRPVTSISTRIITSCPARRRVARARRIDRIGRHDVADLRRPTRVCGAAAWPAGGAPAAAGARPAPAAAAAARLRLRRRRLGLSAAAAAAPRPGRLGGGRSGSGGSIIDSSSGTSGGGVSVAAAARRAAPAARAAAAAARPATMRTSMEATSPTISFIGLDLVSAQPPPTWKKITSASTPRCTVRDSGSM